MGYAALAAARSERGAAAPALELAQVDALLERLAHTAGKGSAAKNGNSPWVVQSIVTAIAFLVWSYATDARAYEVMRIAVVPSVSGLLIAAFTVLSGLIIPVKK